MTVRVLVADDSPLVRRVVRQQLEDGGYEVLEAADGADALAVATEGRPDVVLLDAEMPAIDGRGVLQAMRDDPRLAEVPVIFLTAESRLDEVVATLDAGASDYLRKPFAPAELLARVAAAARMKALHDALRQRAEELERLARTDLLTGLPNRRHLDEQLVRLASAARRHRTPLAVLMVDVDHFRRVNEGHGHSGGDAVLHEVARRLRRTVRTEDIGGRWGGEEFLVLVPSTGLDGGWRLGERIRAAVADEPMALPSGATVYVTVSIGAAAGDGAEPERLVSRADDALAEAKLAGRNQVRAASDPA